MLINSDKSLSSYIVEYKELNYIKKLKILSESEEKFEDSFNPFYCEKENEENFGMELDLNVIWDGIDKKKYKLFPEKFSNCDLSNNNDMLDNLKNCLNVLKERGYLIKRLFEIDTINSSRSNGIWVNVDNNWRLVVVDYNLPYIMVNDKKELLYTRTSDNTIWNNLIEKSLAKSLGSYEKILNFSFNELFYQISGIMPRMYCLEDSNEIFNIIKNAININKILTCHKTSNKNSGKLNDILYNDKRYIIYDYINKANNEKGIKLKSVKEIENFQSLNFENDEKNLIKMSWEEFLEEFEFISVIETELNYINNLKFDNEEYNVVKLFVPENNKFIFNFLQNSYASSEIKNGIQNWKQPEKELFLNATFDNEEDHTSKNEEFIRSRIRNRIELSSHNISIYKVLSEYEVEFMEEFSMDSSIETKALNLQSGEYLVIIQSNWKFNELLNTFSLQFNGFNEFNMQTIVKNKYEIQNFLFSSTSYKSLIKDNQELLNQENYIFQIKNMYIKLNEILDENENKYFIIETNSETPIEIKFKPSNKKEFKFLQGLNTEEDITINISNLKPEVIFSNNKNNRLTFKGMIYQEETDFNKAGKLLFECKKYRNYKNFYYLTKNEIIAGCGNCIIY